MSKPPAAAAAEFWSTHFSGKSDVTVADVASKFTTLPDGKKYKAETIKELVQLGIVGPKDSKVNQKALESFLGRFGPIESCISRGVGSLFQSADPVIPYPWFHSTEKDGTQHLKHDGNFLIRFSANHPGKIILSYSKLKDGTIFAKDVVILNDAKGFHIQEKADKFPLLHELITFEKSKDRLKHAIPSPIYIALMKKLGKEGDTYAKFDESGVEGKSTSSGSKPKEGSGYHQFSGDGSDGGTTKKSSGSNNYGVFPGDGGEGGTDGSGKKKQGEARYGAF